MAYFYLLIALFCVNITSAQSSNKAKQFILKGKVLRQEGGYVYLNYLNGWSKPVYDSCLLKRGYFKFKGTINEPTLAVFYGRRKSRSVDDPNSMELFLEPGMMNAVFEKDHFKKGRVSGSKSNDEHAAYNQQKEVLNHKWKPMFDALERAKIENDSSKLENIYNTQLPLYSENSHKLAIDFIKQFPLSYVSANLLVYQTQRLPLDSLRALYALLSPTIQNSRDGQRIREFIARADNLQIGKMAPNITQIDVKGKSVSLSDFVGNYVLVDFWASWCIPCREEHPYLTQVYKKYKDKGFAIISISLDRLADKNNWLEAIEKDNLLWTQLCDFEGWGSPIVKLYNLFGKGIPANFLIGPSGEIVEKDLRGEQLEMKLAALLK